MVLIRVVDLFAGCGGFSLGAHQAGLQVVAAIDNDPVLISSYYRNFTGTKVIVEDVARVRGRELEEIVGPIDGVVGGPPCQGFSSIGKRLPEDPRRQLLQECFRVVKEVQPQFFVMENVRGLAFADALGELNRAMRLVHDEYECLGPVMLNAADFGAATERVRLFVVGTHKDRCEAVTGSEILEQRKAKASVREAILDLDGAVLVGDVEGFDVWKSARDGDVSGYSRKLRAVDGCFTGHRPTRHCDRVRKRFSEVPPGGVDKVGRHRRLSWLGRCPALRAGTGPDRGSYQSVRPLHPEYDRVITVREAARLQGFPDSHVFHPTVWHSFRMIGNSVSPFVGRAIFELLSMRLGLERAKGSGKSEK